MNNKNINDSTRIIIKDENNNYTMYTIEEIAREKECSSSTIRKRLAKGMTIEEAINVPINERFKRVIDPRNGKEVYLHELAKEIGMIPDTLHSRVFELGWTIEKAISEPLSDKTKKKEITSDLGDTFSYNSWDIILGFGRGTVSHKIKRGKTEQEAISTGNRNGIFFVKDNGRPVPQDQVGEDDFIN